MVFDTNTCEVFVFKYFSKYLYWYLIPTACEVYVFVFKYYEEVFENIRIRPSIRWKQCTTGYLILHCHLVSETLDDVYNDKSNQTVVCF